MYYVNMKRSIPVVQKKRGRPATGQDPVTAIRLSGALRTRLDQWRGAQEDQPSRSEAIRRLVEHALVGRGVTRPPSKEAAHEASKMAARELEPLGDKSLPAEEQARRKRVLIKGPKEFRELRSRQVKTK